MQVRVRMWVLVLASVASLVSGQQAASSSRIQALVSQLAAAPRHHSPSPSYSSDRRISVDQVSCDWSSVVTAPSSHLPLARGWAGCRCRRGWASPPPPSSSPSWSSRRSPSRSPTGQGTAASKVCSVLSRGGNEIFANIFSICSSLVLSHLGIY